MRLFSAPHPAFALIWSCWWLTVCYSLPYVSASPEVAVALLGGFALYETLALRSGNWRNTLSACVTWVVYRLSRHRKPLRGWNNIVPIVAAPISAMTFLMSVGYLPGLPGTLLGLLFAICSFLGLHDHWLDPAQHG